MKTRKMGYTLLLLSSLLQAETISYKAYVKVVSSTPEYESVIERTPIQECWDERVPVTYYEESYSNSNNYQVTSGYRNNDTTAAAIIGGVAGGVLGHQIGKGKGKDVATIGGAILGTIAGQNMATTNTPPQSAYNPRPVTRVPHTRYETKRHCSTHYEEKRVRNFMGYKNVGYYKGKKIVKYSDRKLSRIPITITISY